jgi:hypothetical protein
MALLAGACVASRKNPAGDTAAAAADRAFLADAVLVNWARDSQAAGRLLVETYGVPDAVHPDSLEWFGNGRWKRTVVQNVTPEYGHPQDLALVTQTVYFPLTTLQSDALSSYDARFVYDAWRKELSIASPREAVNVLRFNLAYDVVARMLTPRQARDQFAQILSLEAAGKSSSYMSTLKIR